MSMPQVFQSASDLGRYRYHRKAATIVISGSRTAEAILLGKPLSGEGGSTRPDWPWWPFLRTTGSGGLMALHDGSSARLTVSHDLVLDEATSA